MINYKLIFFTVHDGFINYYLSCQTARALLQIMPVMVHGGRSIDLMIMPITKSMRPISDWTMQP